MSQSRKLRWQGGHVHYVADAEGEVYCLTVLADGGADQSIHYLIHNVAYPLLRGEEVPEALYEELNEDCRRFARFMRANLPDEERIRQGLLVRRQFGAGIEVVPVEMAALHPRGLFEILG